MKRGQMEIMGLIMITIIAGLLLVFALNFLSKLGERDEFAHEPFGERIVSSNFVSVMAKTDVPLCSLDFASLVKDCAKYNSITCVNETGHSNDACHYVSRVANETLNNSLDQWGLSYRFIIQGPNAKLYEKTGFNCTDSSIKEAPGRYIVPLYPDPKEAMIILEVCKT